MRGGLLQDPAWADDLVQEAFIRAMGHLDILGMLQPYQRRAWLHRTLKNLFLDEVRRHQRQERLVEQLGGEIASASAASYTPLSLNPFDLVPPRYQDLVEKRYMLGMTSEEIGKELDIPAATVRSRLHLAMKKMRERAEELGVKRET